MQKILWYTILLIWSNSTLGSALKQQHPCPETRPDYMIPLIKSCPQFAGDDFIINEDNAMKDQFPIHLETRNLSCIIITQ